MQHKIKVSWWVWWPIIVMVIVIGGSILFASMFVNYVLGGGAARDAGHFVKVFEESKR